MDQHNTPKPATLAGFLLEESLTSSRDDWHTIGVQGDSPLARLFADAATDQVTIYDRYGEQRTYRRTRHLQALIDNDEAGL